MERLAPIKNLQALDLSNNELESLPIEIGELQALQNLDISANDLSSEIDAVLARLAPIKNLQALDLSNNNLERLPVEIGTFSDNLDLKVLSNPLTDPPIQLAARGIKDIRKWFDLKARPGASWVGCSTLSSILLQHRSICAAAETVIISAIAAAAVVSGFDLYVWIWAAFAPLLLLRTDDSIKAGLTGYKRLVKWLRIRKEPDSRRLSFEEWKRINSEPEPWLNFFALPFRLLALGIGSIATKFAVTLWFLWRPKSWRAIPENFTHFTQRVDWRSPPELVPGAEKTYPTDPANVFILFDLGKDFTENPYFSGYDTPSPLAKRMAGVLMLGPFFLFAWAYRFSIKATALLYWPFLMFYRFKDEEEARTYATHEATNFSWPKAGWGLGMMGMVTFSLLALARINNLPWLQKLLADVGTASWLGGLADKLVPHIPKAFFAALLALSGLYLFSRLCLFGVKHAIAHLPDHEASLAALGNPGPARNWFNVARFSWFLINLAACALCAVTYSLVLPLAWNRGSGIWNFFFS